MLRDGLLSVLAFVLALIGAIVVGAFQGYSTNPDRTAAFDAAHMELARSGVIGTLEELQKRQLQLAQKHPGFNSPDPPTVIAILKYHPLLLGAFSLALLLLFRPSMPWIAAVLVPAAAVTYGIIGLTAALGVFGAVVLSCSWSALYGRFRKKVAL